jgi:hypothetical protein
MLGGVEWSHPLDHKRGTGWDGGFLLANQSAIQQLFLTTSHKKTLHLVGAQDFHMRCHASKVVNPLKNARYADLDEKVPKLSNLWL